MQREVRKTVIYISIRVGRTQGFDILVLKLISAYIKSILLNNACNACVARERRKTIRCYLVEGGGIQHFQVKLKVWHYTTDKFDL